MPIDEPTVYEVWDVRRTTISSRSRLYHLSPIGVGTPYVESLASYTARLAEAHSAPVGALIADELLPHCERPYLAADAHHRASALHIFLSQNAVSLNGTQTWASDWVHVLQTLTQRADLRFLTMLTWFNVLATEGLLRRAQAWCPACLTEWRRNGQLVYEPLLWALGVVTVCPYHCRHLSSHCPNQNCQQPVPVLARRSRPGCCPRCEGWLGLPVESEPGGLEALSPSELEWQTWVADMVGELLRATPGLSVAPQRKRIAEVITADGKQVTHADFFHWSCTLRLDLTIIEAWQRGQRVPQLGTLLQVCYCLGMSPLRLLTQATVMVDLNQVNMQVVKDQLSRYVKQNQRAEPRNLRSRLEEILVSDEEPPPSVSQVARRLEYNHLYLHRRFPELCSAISTRYRNYRTIKATERKQNNRDQIRQATLDLHAQGVYPTMSKIRAFCCNSWLLIKSEERDVWHEALRELGLIL
jgi:hypothetical protein